MKHIISFLAIAIIAIGNFNSTAITKKKADMPVKTDKYGFYSVLSCPTSLSFLKAASEQEEEGTYTVNIYRGRNLSQSFNLEVTSGDLHFFDANFDGNIDIMAGPATSREYSAILLWDESKKEFVANEGYLNGNFLVNPTKKIIVGQGSGSYCSEYYTRYIWHGQKLVPIETLVEITDPKAYAEYGVKCRYTLVVSDNFDNIKANKTYETNKKSKLPKEWLDILAAYGM